MATSGYVDELIDFYFGKSFNFTQEAERAKRLMEEFELVKRFNIFLPNRGDDYYTENGGSLPWVESLNDIDNLRIGDCFRTPKEATQHLLDRSVYNQLSWFGTPYKKGSYTIMLDGERLIVKQVNERTLGAIYFESEELAREAINFMGEHAIKMLF